jgi:hypothetical protein
MTSTTEETTMPLSGEAIRAMNYVDDIATTVRRILITIPALSAEDRQRVLDHVRATEPSHESLIAALESK